MIQTRNCPECGLPLANGGAEGLCMHCLLGAGVSETMTEQRTAGAQRVPQALPDFGPYHTIGVLGEGGMGIVYLAEQRQPVRRRVALKVLKSPDLGSTVLARFQSESQALALMDHPNIAHIYDAGATSSGRPYFAMEYVPGIPITDYCDRNLLGFRERLALFQQVCHAVHHAHQKGIVHRDIKPSNVLITLQDGKPVPKVIDFGVAKALNQRLVEKTLFTEIGMLIGTPEYMSPEQADLTGLDIDSTTDIYSLGVLLYELLVGARPFDSKTLRKAGYAEIQRIIRETEPPKLSTRLTSMGGEAAQEIARQRHSDVRSLVRLVRGDLEWITMKALEKDRTRRYASASEFAADIGRHLASEPVLAGAPDIGYRTRKFIRRNKGLVAAGSAVALALLIGAVVSFVLYLRTVRAQERAEAESYSATLIAANLQLRAGETEDARAKLANTSPALRGWEWRHLMARTDQSIATIYVPDLLSPEAHVVTQQMRFSADGAQLFSYGNGFLRSWDLATKHMATDLSGLGRILAVGPYGRTVLVGPQLTFQADPPPEGYDLRLYDVSSRQVLSVLRGMNGDPDEAAISGDGGLVAVALDNTDLFKIHAAPIMVWNAHTGEVTARLEGHPKTVTSLRFSPDGRLLASASTDHTVRLWHLASRREAITLRHESSVRVISFSSDGRLLASGSPDGKICIWDIGTGQLQRVWNDSGLVSSVEFSPDASLLATSSAGAIRLWETRTGRLAQELGNRRNAHALAFHPVAPRLYSAEEGVIHEWDLSGHGGVIDDAKIRVRIAVSPNGRWLASASADGKLRIYDAGSANLLWAWSAHTGPVYALAFSPDSEMVASGSLDAIKIWRVPGGQLLRTMTGHTDVVWSVAFHPDGRRLISSSRDNTIRVWQMTSSAPPVIIPTTDISGLAVNHDGRIIMALRRSDHAVLLWDAETKQSLGTLSSGTTELYPEQPRSFALSRDEQILVAPADTGSAIAIWDFPRRRLLRILPVLRGGNGIDPIAISPDASRVAVGGVNSGSLSIWDLRNGRLVVTLSGHNAGMWSLAWSQDGARLFSSSKDGIIRIWDSRSPHNFEAELLLDKISERCLLVDELIQELNADSTLSPELRREAIQLAAERGNAEASVLLSKAGVTGMAQNRSSQEYMRALRRAYAGTQVVPWLGSGYVVLALLQYRTGDFDQALVSAQRAMEIKKSEAPDVHALRAMAYYRLHDLKRARSELALGLQAAREFSNDPHANAPTLLEEAQSLIGERQGVAMRN